MAVINVYEQYFSAKCDFNGVPRKGALVTLVSDSGSGFIRYEAAVSFFPHCDENDFAVSYDAYQSEELFSGPGRRSKKREALLLDSLREHIDAISLKLGGPFSGMRLSVTRAGGEKDLQRDSSIAF